MKVKEVKMSGDVKPMKVGVYKRDAGGTKQTTYSYWNGEYWCMNHVDKEKVSFKGSSMWQTSTWYDEVPEFTNMKFRTPTPEISEAVQKKLFEMGYQWVSGGTQIRPEKEFLFVREKGEILSSAQKVFENDEIFSKFPEMDVVLTKIISVEFISVAPTIVEFNGKKYDKVKLEAALKAIEEL